MKHLSFLLPLLFAANLAAQVIDEPKISPEQVGNFTAANNSFLLSNTSTGAGNWVAPGSIPALIGAITGSGAANRIALWNGTSTVTSDAGLTWTAGGNLTMASGTVSNLSVAGYVTNTASGVLGTSTAAAASAALNYWTESVGNLYRNSKVSVGDGSSNGYAEKLSVDGALGINGTGATSYFLVRASGANIGIFGSDASIGGGSATDFGLYVYNNNNLDLWTNSAIRLRVAGNGNVGIGTGATAPATKLDVAGGAINVAGATYGLSLGITAAVPNGVGGFYSTTGTTSGYVHMYANLGDMRLSPESGGNGLFLQKTTGYVGIGNLAPSTNLHVTGNVRITGLSAVGYATTDGSGNLATTTVASASAALNYWTLSGADVYRNSNVGIGTVSTSAYTLDVHNSSTAIPAARFYQSATTNNYGPAIVVRNNDNSVYANSSIHFQNSVGDLVTIVGSTNETYNNSSFPALTPNGTFFYSANNFGAVAVGGDFLFQTGTGANGIKAVIKNGGNVGIGTTGPDRKLDILDATAPQLRLTYADGSIYTDMQTTSAGYLSIAPSGGNVGIGTTTPASKLQVTAGAGSNTAITFGEGGSNASWITLYGPASSFVSQVYSDNTFRISPGGVGSSTGITITTAGKVGIGTTNPHGQLANTATTSGISSPTATGISWVCTDNDWGMVFRADPPTGNAYGARIHTTPASYNDYIFAASSGASGGALHFTIRGDGKINIPAFTTAGNLVSVLNSSGDLTSASPYDFSGTLTANRTMTLGTNSFTFDASGATASTTTLIQKGRSSGITRVRDVQDGAGTAQFREELSVGSSLFSLNVLNAYGLKLTTASGGGEVIVSPGGSWTTRFLTDGTVRRPQLTGNPASILQGSEWFDIAAVAPAWSVGTTAGDVRHSASIEGDLVGNATAVVTASTHTPGARDYFVQYNATTNSQTITLGLGLSEGREYLFRCRNNGTNTVTFNADTGNSCVFYEQDTNSATTTSIVAGGVAGVGFKAPFKIYKVRRSGTVIWFL